MRVLTQHNTDIKRCRWNYLFLESSLVTVWLPGRNRWIDTTLGVSVVSATASFKSIVNLFATVTSALVGSRALIPAATVTKQSTDIRNRRRRRVGRGLLGNCDSKGLIIRLKPRCQKIRVLCCNRNTSERRLRTVERNTRDRDDRCRWVNIRKTHCRTKSSRNYNRGAVFISVGTEIHRDIGRHHSVTTKANASNVIRLINENVIFFDNIRFISLFLWNKIFKLKPKNLTEGKK